MPLSKLQGDSLCLAQMLLSVAPAFISYGYNQAGVSPLATLQSWYFVPAGWKWNNYVMGLIQFVGWSNFQRLIL